ncbi:MAG: carbohydrate kinase [Gammaproteobacteria bacterium HGW-Gammaproteobacteria-3]|nr:MAG: carbohydrate kinase [Gammaproteobacteria bacterium HGW-Gammaproteobacteria-3]
MTPKRITVFGEVLFDHFPDGSRVLGGAPFNVAWHLQAFGQAPFFISRVGKDGSGTAIRSAMQSWRMDLSGLQTDPHYPTGAVQVTIEQGEPDYVIVPEQAYDFLTADELNAAPNDGLLYHGTLALRHANSRQALAALKARHIGPVFMDVNLREPWWQKDHVLEWVGCADWVKLNQHELRALHSENGTIETAMRSLSERHGLTGLVVTCGKDGARAIDNRGEIIKVAPVAALEVIDTVGAGDAFASVLLLGINQGWPLPLILTRAQAFASALVGRRGATVREAHFYQTFTESWGL